MSNITIKEYTYLANRVAYWLEKNNKQFNKRPIYGVDGREADYRTIRNALLNRGTNYQTDKMMAEFVECAVHDNRSNLGFLPNYVTGSDGRVYQRDVFVNMANYVSKYEVDHNGVSPVTVPIDDAPVKQETKCNSPWTQTPMLISQKKGSLGQVTSYSCGPHSLMQAFYHLTGINVAESTIMAWAGTTSSGTGHQGLNTAVAQFNKKYNQNLKITWKNLSDFGGSTAEQFRNIGKLKCEGKYVFFHLLYRNQYGHYEAYKTNHGVDQKFDIANSLGSRSGSGYIGYIENRTYNTQRQYINGISQPSVAILYK